MTEYSYNTHVSLIKAGRLINTKITISLILIWAAFAIVSVFLLINKAGFSLLVTDVSKYNILQTVSAGQTEKQTNEGAFVLVVKNKQMILTRYTAYIDNNQPDADVSTPDIATSATQKNTAAIVRKPKNIRQEKQTDFSVKRVPNQ